MLIYSPLTSTCNVHKVETELHSCTKYCTSTGLRYLQEGTAITLFTTRHNIYLIFIFRTTTDWITWTFLFDNIYSLIVNYNNFVFSRWTIWTILLPAWISDVYIKTWQWILFASINMNIYIGLYMYYSGNAQWSGRPYMYLLVYIFTICTIPKISWKYLNLTQKQADTQFTWINESSHIPHRDVKNTLRQGA